MTLDREGSKCARTPKYGMCLQNGNYRDTLMDLSDPFPLLGRSYPPSKNDISKLRERTCLPFGHTRNFMFTSMVRSQVWPSWRWNTSRRPSQYSWQPFNINWTLTMKASTFNPKLSPSREYSECCFKPVQTDTPRNPAEDYMNAHIPANTIQELLLQYFQNLFGPSKR